MYDFEALEKRSTVFVHNKWGDFQIYEKNPTVNLENSLESNLIAYKSLNSQMEAPLWFTRMNVGNHTLIFMTKWLGAKQGKCIGYNHSTTI